jgi:Acyl-protein synthetase, LuxE
MQSTPPDVRQWLHNDFDFEAARDAVWAWQLQHNPVMKSFAEKIGRTSPFFFPVSFFRDFRNVTVTDWTPETIFRSSGTTGQVPSVHEVKSAALYHEASLRGFQHFFGDRTWRILALLPGYLERPDASLVEMVRNWILHFGTEGSGFFLHDHSHLAQSIESATAKKEKVLLIGVAFALLDFAESQLISLPPHSLVIETGGMKGNRKELVRRELHDRLIHTLAVDTVQSEYGMTELLSQAYAKSDGIFHCPPWMRVTICDLHHPWLEVPQGHTGRICITDLMNVHSCSFLRTDDIGRVVPGGGFEVLGRADHSELRGCGLMYL